MQQQKNYPIIETRNLSKSYGRGVKALDSLSLSVQPGEIFGYLGPNGAGKTTTIRILLDLIRPTGGQAQLFGQDVRGQAVELHKRIGFLPGELNLWKGLTGREVMHYMARVRGMADWRYADQLIDRLKFDPSLRVRSYSTGNKRKLGLVLALMHKPELLILDEPSSGLDPLMQQTFNELMLETKADGRTVFLSSHVLSEVQAICDRAAILNGGQLKTVSTVEALTRSNVRLVTLKLKGGGGTALLQAVPGVSDLQEVDGHVTLRLTGDFDPLLKALAGSYVEDMHVEEPSLEDIFLGFYGNGTAVSNGRRMADRTGASS
jgi:ABC-2 type transport system ATP-binding protein